MAASAKANLPTKSRHVRRVINLATPTRSGQAGDSRLGRISVPHLIRLAILQFLVVSSKFLVRKDETISAIDPVDS